MLDRVRHIREPYRMLLIGASTALVMMISKTWPGISYLVWGIFIGSMALLLYFDLREPVNYESLHVSAGVVKYTAVGQQHVFRLAEVSKLEFVREEALFPDLDGPYIESKWVVQFTSRSSIEVMDERPHRKLLLRAFKEHLEYFDAGAARQGLEAHGAGRWLCYEARHASA